MSAGHPELASTRRALESSFGLALEGLVEDQVRAAVEAALARGTPLAAAPDEAFLAAVIDGLPIDESWLFRDEGLWRWVEGDLGPELLQRALARGSPIRALSIGCAAGQEAFSLAIALQGVMEAAGFPPSAAARLARVDGIDSSPARIQQARTGLVGAWSVHRCQPRWLRGRVSPGDAGGSRYQVDRSVRDMCRFEVGNLVEIAERAEAALAGYDLVLCRHVLIYFKAERAAGLVQALARALEPGTVLVLAAAEAHLAADPGLLPLAHLGAARAVRPEERPSQSQRPRPRRSGLAPRAARSRPRSAAPSTPPMAPAAPEPRASAADAGSRHFHAALLHASAGRGEEALREARAACFLEPRHLYFRLMLARALVAHDRQRGLRVLREVLDALAVLPADAEVPSAPGLSAAQLAAAARLLLAKEERP